MRRSVMTIYCILKSTERGISGSWTSTEATSGWRRVKMQKLARDCFEQAVFQKRYASKKLSLLVIVAFF